MIIRISVFLFLLALITSTQAQIEYLRLSPSQKISQRVGATDVTIELSRPQMKGRVIFGGLIPYDKMWRTGANENTKISFGHRVKIGETEVAEGTYSLITKPNEKLWEIFFYTDTNNLDIPNPIDSSKLIYLTTVESNRLNESQETMVINIYDISETTANLGISWDKTAIKIPITFYTREAMDKMINKEFKQNILDYSIAAAYYSQRSIELEKAKKIQEIAIELRDKPSAWAYHEYAITLVKLGEDDAAKKAIEYSLELAKENNIEYLIQENNKLLNKQK